MKRVGLAIAVLAMVGVLAVSGVAFYRKSRLVSAVCEQCNLVVISVSHLRKSHIGIYGYDKNVTPNIDRFFSKGWVFDNAIAPGGTAHGNALAMFYSIFPQSPLIFGRTERRIKRTLAQTTSLAEVLHTKGYARVGVVADEEYNHKYGLGAGFSPYVDASLYPDYGIAFEPKTYQVTALDLMRPVLEHVDRVKQGRFFLFLQLFDMHCPYAPDPEVARRLMKDYSGPVRTDRCYLGLPAAAGSDGGKMLEIGRDVRREVWLEPRDLELLTALYDRELSRVDAALGLFFDQLAKDMLTENTIVVFLSEHGEYMGEGGNYARLTELSPGSLHNNYTAFPLLIRHPKVENSKKIDAIVRTVDLGPTWLDLLGIEDPRSSIHGLSLLPAIINDSAMNEYAYSSVVRVNAEKERHSVEALQNIRWKLTRETRIWWDGVEKATHKYVLVDKRSDPNEERDVLGDNADLAQRMVDQLNSFRERHFVKDANRTVRKNVRGGKGQRKGRPKGRGQ